jgi:hypothetical protein
MSNPNPFEFRVKTIPLNLSPDAQEQLLNLILADELIMRFWTQLAADVFEEMYIMGRFTIPEDECL